MGTLETTDLPRTGNIPQAVFDNKDFSQRMILKGLSCATGGDDLLGSQGMTINYDDSTRLRQHQQLINRVRALDEEEEVMEEHNCGDMMVEEFDFIGNIHNEEYVKV